jgi:hypothetical protein
MIGTKIAGVNVFGVALVFMSGLPRCPSYNPNCHAARHALMRVAGHRPLDVPFLPAANQCKQIVSIAETSRSRAHSGEE